LISSASPGNWSISGGTRAEKRLWSRTVEADSRQGIRDITATNILTDDNTGALTGKLIDYR